MHFHRLIRKHFILQRIGEVLLQYTDACIDVSAREQSLSGKYTELFTVESKFILFDQLNASEVLFVLQIAVGEVMHSTDELLGPSRLQVKQLVSEKDGIRILHISEVLLHKLPQSSDHLVVCNLRGLQWGKLRIYAARWV